MVFLSYPSSLRGQEVTAGR